MRDRVPLILLIVAIIVLAVVMARGQSQSTESPTLVKKTLDEKKLDFERYRRIWNSTNAELQGSFSQQQKDLMARMTALEGELKMKEDAIKQELDCEGKKKNYNQDLLICEDPAK